MIHTEKICAILRGRTVRFACASSALALLVMVCGLAADRLMPSGTDLPVLSGETERYTFVIDAGHGGEDGGAVATDGTEEKNLNLAISNALYGLLTLNGQSTVATRQTDTLLYDYFHDREDYTGQKKMYDLRNRLRITEREENAVYVGIHMNKFTDPQYSGLQVYYSKNSEKSSALAGTVQMYVRNSLQSTNDRAIKPAGQGIYILSEAKVPAILIECGFLSNPAECAALRTEAYQRQLTAAIFYALSTFETAEADSLRR